MVDAQVKHGMLCPLCKTDLMMTDRQGVEIDYCPKCRGVWLDRGELDKLIERSAGMDAPQASHPQGQPYPPAQPYPSAPPQPYAGGPYDPRYEGRRYRDDDDDDYKRRHYDPRYRKKKSWLGEMLDFD